MTLFRLVALVSMLAAVSSAADANGKWKLEMLGDPATWPKVVLEVILDLKTDGQRLTGVAHAGPVARRRTDRGRQG
jgi:hypothetical protein